MDVVSFLSPRKNFILKLSVQTHKVQQRAMSLGGLWIIQHIISLAFKGKSSYL